MTGGNVGKMPEGILVSKKIELQEPKSPYRGSGLKLAHVPDERDYRHVTDYELRMLLESD